jgi:hypothetical protein
MKTNILRGEEFSFILAESLVGVAAIQILPTLSPAYLELRDRPTLTPPTTISTRSDVAILAWLTR